MEWDDEDDTEPRGWVEVAEEEEEEDTDTVRCISRDYKTQKNDRKGKGSKNQIQNRYRYYSMVFVYGNNDEIIRAQITSFSG